MSKIFQLEGMDFDVDEVFAAFDNGNKQHMANKLYKHGWAPVKAVRYLPEDVIEKLEAAREYDDLDIATASNIEAGNRVYLYDPASCMHGDEYMVIRNGRNGGFRLVSTTDGNYWNFESLFGFGDIKFTRKRVGQ